MRRGDALRHSQGSGRQSVVTEGTKNTNRSNASTDETMQRRLKRAQQRRSGGSHVSASSLQLAEV